MKIIMGGKRRILSLEISNDVVAPHNVELLQEMITSAINSVVEEIDREYREHLEKITGGISIPGLF